jgi:hypothetical protein
VHDDLINCIICYRVQFVGYMDFRQTYSALGLPRLVEDGARFEDAFVDAYFVTRLLIERGVVAFDTVVIHILRRSYDFFVRVAAKPWRSTISAITEKGAVVSPTGRSLFLKSAADRVSLRR